MQILIVDNDTSWTRYAAEVLENEGHHVEIIADNKKAYAKIRNTKFDLILYDIKAFKVARKVLCQLMLKQVINRLIVAAALPNYKDAMDVKWLGASDYIDKTYNNNEIINVINKNIHTIPLNRVYLKKRLKEAKCI